MGMTEGGWIPDFACLCRHLSTCGHAQVDGRQAGMTDKEMGMTKWGWIPTFVGMIG